MNLNEALLIFVGGFLAAYILRKISSRKKK